MNRVVPDPRTAECFRFDGCAFDSASGEASLSYRFDDGPELVERLQFAHAPWPPEASRQAAFQQALHLLHLVAGVSYYKAGLCRRMSFGRLPPDPALAEFLTQLYVEGLAEFGHVNRLDVAGRVSFPVASTSPDPPRPLMLPERALVAMGGGKDSLVGLDILRRSRLEVLPAFVGESNLVAETVEAAGLPLLRIRRALAPELAVMNDLGAWNGHVPVTAINSAILVCAAILYGYRYVVFANERSADEPTLRTPEGAPVNHQYSKSSAFERALRDIVASHISPDIEYFSVLRPYSEIGVVRRFSELTQYHALFSSCNRNFHLDGSRIDGRWCRNCPKCRFAALTLSLYLSRPEVESIQGGVLLEDDSQLDGFRALCGLGMEKPFECVGEAGESRAALAALAATAECRESAIVKALAPELDQVSVPPMKELLKPSSAHFIPPSVLAVAQEVMGRDAG